MFCKDSPDMAWRPERLVKAGELDNTRLGWTVGWLELEGVDGRLQLKLAGNCHPDLAGWKFRIRRFEPELPLTEDDDARITPESVSTNPVMSATLRPIR